MPERDDAVTPKPEKDVKDPKPVIPTMLPSERESVVNEEVLRLMRTM